MAHYGASRGSEKYNSQLSRHDPIGSKPDSTATNIVSKRIGSTKIITQTTIVHENEVCNVSIWYVFRICVSFYLFDVCFLIYFRIAMIITMTWMKMLQ